MLADAKSTVARPRTIFALVIVWTAFAVVTAYFFFNTGGGAIDFEGYYHASKAIATQDSPYGLREQGLSNHPYFYPPLLAIGLLPLAPLSLAQAAAIWLVLNFALLLFTLWLVSRYIEDQKLWLLWWVAPVFFTPTLLALVHGQATVLMFALVAGMWVAMRHEKRRLAGVLLALALWVKIYPIIFIAYFFWKREWRVVASALVGAALLGLFQIIWVGWTIFSAFFTDVLFGLGLEGEPSLSNLNSSVVGFTSRLFVASPRVQPLIESAALYTISRVAISLLIVGITVLLSSRPAAYGPTPSRKRDLEFGLITLGSLLLASTLWESGMVSLLLVYLFPVRDALRPLNRRVLLVCALSFVLIDSYRLIWPLARDRTLPALLLSTPFFGAILLWAVTAIQAWFASGTKPVSTPSASAVLPSTSEPV